MISKNARRRRGGQNRRTIYKKKSGGALGWVILLIILGGIVYAGFTVPVMGKTAYGHVEKLFGAEVVRSGTGQKTLTELQRTEPDTRPKGGGTVKIDDKPKKSPDKLTEEDKKELNNLLEEKMRKK
ncbi:MAG: hypothetical protein WC889_15300 [Myxococcota bacterium]|jgi:hypothetical protein